MIRLRRHAAEIVCALFALPCFGVAVAAGQIQTPIDGGLGDHVPALVTVIGSIAATGLTCYGIAAHKADANLKEMRQDREKDIKAALLLHDGAEGAHRVASDHNHRPLEQIISSLSLRLHDTEGSLGRLEDGQGKLLDGQIEIRKVLYQLKSEHEATMGGPACVAAGRDPTQTRKKARGSDPTGADFTPIRGRS